MKEKLQLHKKGAMDGGMIVVLLIAGLLVGYLVVPNFFGQQQQAVQGSQAEQIAEAIVAADVCPDNQDTVVTFNVFNDENQTLGEEYAANIYVYELGLNPDTSSSFSILADTQAATLTLPCGRDWLGRQRTSNVADGNNTRVRSVSGDAATLEGDDFKFTTKGSRQTINVVSSRHGTLEFRVFDESGSTYFDEDGATDSAVGAYQASPAQYESITNGTVITLGAGERLDTRIDYRSVSGDDQWNDRGAYMTVNVSSTTVWDTPTVRSDGVTLVDVKGSLDPHCAKLYASGGSQEYVYKIDKNVPNIAEGSIDFQVKAFSDQDPAAGDDVSVSFFAIGTYVSRDDPTRLKVGACTDASSPVTVYAEQIVNFNVA